MIQKPFFVLSASVLALGAIACSTDHGGDTNDAGIVVPDSARPPDAAQYDAGPSAGDIGNACTADTDCGTMGMCLNDPGFFPNGYCSAICDPTAAMDTCPTGSLCQDFGGGQAFCVLTCDSSVTTRQCNGRMGYGCSTDPQLSGICLGGCVDGTDCPTGLSCDQTGGQVGAGACYTPGATVGVACLDDTMCPAGAFCQDEANGGWPGGSCLLPGCDLVGNAGCSGDAQCVALQGFFGPPQGYCIDGCTTTADCRTGYTCTASTANPDRHYCAPGCTSNAQCSGGLVCNPGLGTCGAPFTGTLGGTCSRRDPTTCAGGTCLSERSAGFPMAYCSYSGCSATEACPMGGVCLTRPGTTNICLRACTMDSDCPTAGYACRHSNPADATSAMACVPACTATVGCVNMGDVCNVGTGLCGPAFMSTLEGTPCTSDTQCAGGRCMSEAGFGYSQGECVYPGCSLTTGVMGAACPAMTACVDDHIGSPDLGICAPSCTVGGTSCRDGYTCVAVGGSATEGACQPSCTATSCTPGRTCDTTTHLCH